MNKTLWKNRMTSTHELVKSLIPLEPFRNLIPGLGWFKIHQAMNLTTSQPSSWNEVRGHGRCCLHKACTLGSLTESLLTDGDKLQALVGWWNPIFGTAFWGKSFDGHFPILQEGMYKVQSDSLVLIHHVQMKIQNNGDLRLTYTTYGFLKPLETTRRWRNNRIQNSGFRSFHPGVGVKNETRFETTVEGQNPAPIHISNISHGKNDASIDPKQCK